MKTTKMSLASIKGKLSKNEMMKVIGGSFPPGYCRDFSVNIHCTNNNQCPYGDVCYAPLFCLRPC